MDEIDLGNADEPAGARERQRAAVQAFVPDADRAFLYRILSVHARGGVAPADAAAAVAAMMASPEPGETPAAGARRRNRHLGAERLAAALARAGEGSPDTPVWRHLAHGGASLTPEEKATFALPSSCLDRLPLAAEMFAAAASFLQDNLRP